MYLIYYFKYLFITFYTTKAYVIPIRCNKGPEYENIQKYYLKCSSTIILKPFTPNLTIKLQYSMLPYLYVYTCYVYWYSKIDELFWISKTIYPGETYIKMLRKMSILTKYTIFYYYYWYFYPKTLILYQQELSLINKQVETFEHRTAHARAACSRDATSAHQTVLLCTFGTKIIIFVFYVY